MTIGKGICDAPNSWDEQLLCASFQGFALLPQLTQNYRQTWLSIERSYCNSYLQIVQPKLDNAATQMFVLTRSNYKQFEVFGF